MMYNWLQIKKGEDDMRTKFEDPDLTIVYLDNEDIVTASVCPNELPMLPGMEDDFS